MGNSEAQKLVRDAPVLEAPHYVGVWSLKNMHNFQSFNQFKIITYIEHTVFLDKRKYIIQIEIIRLVL